MNTGHILSGLIPVLALMTLASIVELVVPLRRQARSAHGRIAINLALMTLNIGIGMVLNAALLVGAVWVGARGMGVFQLFGISGIPATAITIVVLDAAAYGAHVALHKTPWLWRVHLVHHTDAAVDATTSYRHHPIEPIFRWSITAVVAWTLGAPAAALALYRSLSALNAILEHANIRTPRWLDRSFIWFWVTPDMHKMHHSSAATQTDSNYGNLFSFCDRLFRTFTRTDGVRTVQYGIEGFDVAERQRIRTLLRLPFVRQEQPESGVAMRRVTASEQEALKT